MSSAPASASSALVHEYMTPSVVAVAPEANLMEVLRTISQHNISSVLVCKGKDAAAPLGVVSMTDLFRVAKQRDEEDAGRHVMPLMPAGKTAADVMKKELVTIGKDAEVGDAVKEMQKHGLQRLFVKDGEKVVGVFSTRDAMRVVHARHIETPLKEVMTAPVVTVGIGETIDHALEKLEESNLRGLAVVDIKVPVGIFTQLEAIKSRALSPKLRARPVEEVMSYEMTALDQSTPLYRAAGHGVATELRRILVTHERALVGIATGYDVAKVLVK